MLIDDHGIVRQGLRSILELDPGIQVVAEAEDAPPALLMLEELQPDIVLLDLSIGQYGPARGLEACETISTRYPAIGVIVLTTFLDERFVMQAIQAGAKGYVLKEVDAVDLIRIIRAVSRGEGCIDMRLTPTVLKNIAGAAQAPAPPTELSEREKELIRHLAAGHSNREIGTRMCISESTVKYHLRNIMSKLEVYHRTEVVYAASKLGLV